MIQYDPLVETRSLYIHWPFCPYKCHFCPFVALASHDQYMEQYHKALVAEIRQYADSRAQQSGSKQANPMVIDTIYFGGGTPSTYPDNLLLDMHGILSELFIIGDSTEMTLEVNPGTVRFEQFGVWKAAGINRLSIGVQGLNDQVLASLNRFQKASDVKWLLQEASAYFDNLSIDLILGLPGISAESWKETLYQAVTWPIKHISMYFLTVHEKTPLYIKVQSGKIALPDDDEIVDLYYWSRDFLAEHGLFQYELSNFARPGYESRHNSAYWNRVPYRGFGIGACSFDGTIRMGNDKNLMRYLECAITGQSVIDFSETLTPEQVRLERLMLGLRRVSGVTLDGATQGFTDEQMGQFEQELSLLKQRGLVVELDGVLRLTPPGALLENEVVVKLAQ